MKTLLELSYNFKKKHVNLAVNENFELVRLKLKFWCIFESDK